MLYVCYELYFNKTFQICEAKKMYSRAHYLTKKLETSLNTFNAANGDSIKQCKVCVFCGVNFENRMKLRSEILHSSHD